MSILGLLSTLSACSLRADAAEGSKAKILLLTDREEFQDQAVISAVWKGLCTYGEESDMACLQITATEPNMEARLYALRSSMEPEVQVVVCVGASYETVVFEAQEAYPDVMFLLLDGEPHREQDAVYETTLNTHCILFQETQAGFFAGYAAVMEGYRKLGFCGDHPEPSVIRYGYGFLQGADFAATKLGLNSGEIEVRYWYAGAGQTADVIREQMENWYQNGTQLIFVCNDGNAQLSQTVTLTAETFDGLVIGADADRAEESQVVVCSVVKDYENSVERALSILGENEGRWDVDLAGRTLVLGVKENAIRLSNTPSSWRLRQFTQSEYQKVLDLLNNDEIALDQSCSRELYPAVFICNIVDEG